MSRMQSLLDKAEREGSLSRVHVAAAPPPPRDPVVAVMPPPASATDPNGLRLVARPAPVDLRLNRALVAALAPDSAAAKQYRAVCARIEHASRGAGSGTVLITSPGRGEGKSVTAANLALTLARGEHPVCLVDAHLRAPRIQQMFGLSGGPGLGDVLAARASLDEALIHLEGLGLTILPAGRADDARADVAPTVMRSILETLRSQFGRVVVDAPSALSNGDLATLTPFVDRFVVVVRAGVTDRSAVQDTVAALDPSRLLGVVLNATA